MQSITILYFTFNNTAKPALSDCHIRKHNGHFLKAVTKWRWKVMQKTRTGVFCITFNLHLASACVKGHQNDFLICDIIQKKVAYCGTDSVIQDQLFSHIYGQHWTGSNKNVFWCLLVTNIGGPDPMPYNFFPPSKSTFLQMMSNITCGSPRQIWLYITLYMCKTFANHS